MFRTALVFGLLAALPSAAYAASDNDLAQKCVPGMQALPPNGAVITYQAGGTLSGFRKVSPRTMVHIQGTWEVKDGVLTSHSSGGAGEVTTSFPIRMDDAGKCYMTVDGTERPIQK